jgi:hypothetical protein
VVLPQLYLRHNGPPKGSPGAHVFDAIADPVPVNRPFLPVPCMSAAGEPGIDGLKIALDDAQSGDLAASGVSGYRIFVATCLDETENSFHILGA